MFKIQWEARIAIVVALAVCVAVGQALWQPAPPTTQPLPMVWGDQARIELPTHVYADYVHALRQSSSVAPAMFCGGKLYGRRESQEPRGEELMVLDGAQWGSMPVEPAWTFLLSLLSCRDGHVITWGMQGEPTATFTGMAEFDLTARRATGPTHKAPNRVDDFFVMRRGELMVVTRENGTWVISDRNGATFMKLPSADLRAQLFRRTGELFEPGVVDAWHEQLLGRTSQWWTQSVAPDGASRMNVLGSGVVFDLAASGDFVIVKGAHIRLPSCDGRLRAGVVNFDTQAISTAAGGVRIPVACGYVEFDQQWHRTDAASWPVRIMTAFASTTWLANLRLLFALLAPIVIVALQRFASKRERYVALVLFLLPLQLWAAWVVWFWRSGL